MALVNETKPIYMSNQTNLKRTPMVVPSNKRLCLRSIFSSDLCLPPLDFLSYWTHSRGFCEKDMALFPFSQHILQVSTQMGGAC